MPNIVYLDDDLLDRINRQQEISNFMNDTARDYSVPQEEAMNKTDDQIFDEFCEDYGYGLCNESLKEHLRKTYHFQRYLISVRWWELKQAIFQYIPEWLKRWMRGSKC
jgi:hypothetical protein